MILLLALFACSEPVKLAEPVNPQITDSVTQAELAAFSPLPKDFFKDGSAPSSELISLGEKLFNEKMISADTEISCASCHTLETGGVDGKPFSLQRSS